MNSELSSFSYSSTLVILGMRVKCVLYMHVQNKIYCNSGIVKIFCLVESDEIFYAKIVY